MNEYKQQGGYPHEQNTDLTRTRQANAEAGGDNVHRGMMLGLLLAAGSEDVMEEWKTGRRNYRTRHYTSVQMPVDV